MSPPPFSPTKTHHLVGKSALKAVGAPRIVSGDQARGEALRSAHRAANSGGDTLPGTHRVRARRDRPRNWGHMRRSIHHQRILTVDDELYKHYVQQSSSKNLIAPSCFKRAEVFDRITKSIERASCRRTRKNISQRLGGRRCVSQRAHAIDQRYPTLLPCRPTRLTTTLLFKINFDV